MDRFLEAVEAATSCFAIEREGFWSRRLARDWAAQQRVGLPAQLVLEGFPVQRDQNVANPAHSLELSV